MENDYLDPTYYLGFAQLGLDALVVLGLLTTVGFLLWWLRGEGVFGMFGNVAGLLRFTVGVYVWAIAFLVGMVTVLSLLKWLGLVDILPRISILLAMVGGAATPMLVNYLWCRLRKAGCVKAET